MFGRRNTEGPVIIKGVNSGENAFPRDIWHVIGEYLETLSIIKLEKTCRGMYKEYNKECC